MLISLLLLTQLSVSPAHAGVVVTFSSPNITVSYNPWSATWVPPARDGWHWVNGYWDRWGNWNPGRWVPAYSRAGYSWVDGYWAGTTYYDGYWRPVAKTGYAWVAPVYVGSSYTAGYWRAPDGRREYVEDYREHVEDRREVVEDRQEHWEDQQERVEEHQENWEDQQERIEDHQEYKEDVHENIEDHNQQQTQPRPANARPPSSGARSGNGPHHR
jgi:hypothetical protein